jgi:hypothetical protein
MIFDIIRYGTFTADDFITAQRSNDFSKFIQLPIDLRKKFISDVVDLHPNKESNNLKQATFDFIDGKIIEDQFRDAYWKYRALVYAVPGAEAEAAAAMGLAAAGLAAWEAEAEYYRLYFEQYAKHLNKLIQEYQS